MARKILLADDSVTAQNMGRKILADAGYEVITVNNGSAALKKITEQKPDVIVLDVYMPGYSGLEVCQRLKEVAETARIPILLTVGKLEPFKQDEVKRVRADGFIVKPFEASELLSALTKLEDRIVPRSESSKPGRFARATAALEENRFDRTVANDEDNGWKSRISFPTKKKEPEEEKEAKSDFDDPAIYNPVNKDLRTVVAHKPADAAVPVKANTEDEHVDVGALATPGLPKDVTPEEIAALAAAAAQMQGKIAEIKAADTKSPESTTPETKLVEGKAAEPVPPPPVAVESVKVETKEEPAPVVEAKSEAPAPAATFADQPRQEPAESKEKVATPAASVPEPPAVESRSEANAVSVSAAAPVEIPVEEPVTMAMTAAAAQSSGASSRWAAVSVALAPEDAGISLEQEMQKACAVFSAAVDAGYSSAPAAPESESTLQHTSAPAAESRVSEPEPIPVIPAVQAAENLNDVAGVAAEAMSAVVQELDAVAASLVSHKERASIEPPAAQVETPASVEPLETIKDQTLEVPESRAEATQVEEPEVEAEAEATQPVKEVEPEEPVAEELKVVPAAEDFPVAAAIEAPEPRVETTAASQESSSAAESKLEPAEEVVRKHSPATKEPDIAATTAAAWASWHRIRESGKQDSAKAVAAGAEESPSDAAGTGSDAEVANIVDSVLADLRPKIVEEISRKLGKKK